MGPSQEGVLEGRVMRSHFFSRMIVSVATVLAAAECVSLPSHGTHGWVARLDGDVHADSPVHAGRAVPGRAASWTACPARGQQPAWRWA